MFVLCILLAVAIIGLAFYFFGRYDRSAALGRNAGEAPSMPKSGMSTASADHPTEPAPEPPKAANDDQIFENIVKRLSK